MLTHVEIPICDIPTYESWVGMHNIQRPRLMLREYMT